MAQSDGSAEIKYIQSSFSGADNCVQVGVEPGTGRVAVRHSKHPDTAPLLFSEAEWVAFVKGAVAGEFDVAKLAE